MAHALARVRKAIVGGFAALSASIATAAADGRISTAEWVSALVAAVLAGLAVWAAPANAPEPGGLR